MKAQRLILFSLICFLTLVIPPNTQAVTQEDVVGFWTFNLKPGFNLVSFPVLPDTPTMQEVIGDALGDVEITTWDPRLGRYRWARYDSDAESWSGDLFLVDRGAAYWVNLYNADGERTMIVTGHPEQYTRFRWQSLGSGWQFYAPTIGREELLSDLPPVSIRDLVVAWDSERACYELAEAVQNQRWHSNTFDQFEPDRAYLAYLKTRVLQPIGPLTRKEAYLEQLSRGNRPRLDGEGGDQVQYEMPPYPLIVGNKTGLPVCFENGELCSGGFTVNVVREALRMTPGGELEPFAEDMGRYAVAPGNAEEGRFNMALTVGLSRDFLNPDDRAYLVVRGPNRTETRSTSFEIPEGERFIPDISFPDPLNLPSATPTAPASFAVEAPFPNPFNDRFYVEFSLPETAPVAYRLYDMRGREVYRVERPFTAGFHRLSIKAGNLSAGIYLLQIEAGSRQGLAKVAHIK